MGLRSTINRGLGLMTPVRDLPEFSHLPRSVRGPAIRRAYLHSLGDKRLWALIAIEAAAQFAGFSAAVWFFGSQYNVFGLPRVVVILIAMSAVALASLPPLMMMERHVLRPRIWAQFGELCNGCGYNLTGASADRCPECGRAFAAQDV